jgi:hypothetical protein
MGFAGGGAAVMLVSILASAGYAKPLSWVGKHSLYIFLSFFLPMAAIRVGMVKLGFENGDLITLVATAVAVISPIIVFRLLEKTPLSFLYARPDAFRLTAPRNFKPRFTMTAGGD